MLKIVAPQRNSDNYASPTQHTSTVVLEVWNPGFPGAEVKPPFWNMTVLTSEPLSWSIETSWKDGAAASVAGKINEFMSNKFVRMMSGPELFTPIATDAWSQQVVESGSPIGVKIKFRAYYEPDNPYKNKSSVTCNRSYIDVMKFFSIITAPPKKYSLGTATLGVITAAAKNIVQIGKDIGTAVDGRPEDEGMITATAKYTIAALGDTTGLTTLETPDKAHRGNYTLKIKTRDFGCAQLDWIVKGVSVTPSQQFVASTDSKDTNIKSVPMPLWVDFDVDLETNMTPSNALVARFFSKQDLPLQTPGEC